MLLASIVAWAQANPAPAATQQNPGSQTTPATQPPASSASPAQPGAQSAPAGHRKLEAKSQDEFKAYQDAVTKTDPAQAEAAAGDFAAKFPNSELRSALFQRAMNMYAQAGNSDKVVDLGRKAIAADPINPVPLMEVASTLAETTRDTDLDREQRLAEAAKDAHTAIDNIDTGLLVPENADPERVASAKRTILTNSYATLAMVDMNRNDYAPAVTNLQKAIAESKDNPEAVLYLRLSVAQDKLKDYQPALDSANKAVQYAKPGTPAQNLAKQQQERLQKLIAAESAGAPAASPAPTSPAPFPGGQPANPSPLPGQPAPLPGQSTVPH
jgi:tetratricopeptide (TPR) repeat protein